MCHQAQRPCPRSNGPSPRSTQAFVTSMNIIGATPYLIPKSLASRWSRSTVVLAITWRITLPAIHLLLSCSSSSHVVSPRFPVVFKILGTVDSVTLYTHDRRRSRTTHKEVLMQTEMITGLFTSLQPRGGTDT
jgi:hypothetical protein